jgi:hypothetical protein
MVGAFGAKVRGPLCKGFANLETAVFRAFPYGARRCRRTVFAVARQK